MGKNKGSADQESVKVIIFVILSYIVPLIGIGFSIYILTNSNMKNYSSWIKPLALISLVTQILIILSAVLGIITFLTI
ncbi:hypothetical protein SAMN04488700_0415 [Carnobacterium iners]|uniref:Uncharacterized protein n=1 Tax=Carnobacterium iners TaxID=1073423 RepID=A0A1X7MQR9_9LACT|nr:hypothetical protein [Carnobacterium iners]SEL13494.1 hypothetical protein SAMN04488114_12912 [Carnobacterium iners]SMH27035.1 hypothetical protein SAMN04488700_0415 [Carnobacterium iners]